MRSARGRIGIDSPRSARSRGGLTWLEIVVILAILVVLVALLYPSLAAPRGVPEYSQCRNQLKQIGLALHNYHDEHGSFPPAFTVDVTGRRLHSWRTLILPYLDGVQVHKQIDFGKPWDDPAHAEVAKQMPSMFACPAKKEKTVRTSYLAVVAAGGVFDPGSTTKFASIKDGLANTLLIVEVPVSRSVHWMEPTDLDVAGFESLAKDETGNHAKLIRDGVFLVFADDSIRSVTREELAKYGGAWLTISGGEPVE
jgi:type II secretory pathway pseudopilin PulG